MIEQAITYKMSKGLRRAKERYIYTSILMAIMMVAFIFLSPLTKDDNLGIKVTVGFIALISIGIIFFVTATVSLRKLSELSISMFADRFERESRKHNELYLWKDVQRAEILEFPNGEIASIKLTLAQKKIVTLYGLDDMHTVAKKVEESIPTEASVHRKRMKLNWDQPSVIFITGMLTFVVILAIQEVGENAYRLFNALFYLSFGLYNFIARPISRVQGKGWMLFETIIGSLLSFGAIFTLWSVLLDK
jgi:hypothetical protein